MKVKDYLDNIGFDYTAMLGDICKHLNKGFFNDTGTQLIKVTRTGTAQYVAIEQEGISKIINATKVIVHEDITVEEGVQSASTSPELATSVGVIKIGNKLLLGEIESTTEDIHIIANKHSKTPDNIPSTLEGDLVSLLFYLSSGDKTGVFSVLRRIDTTQMNVVSENTKLYKRRVKSGGIKPCQF